MAFTKGILKTVVLIVVGKSTFIDTFGLMLTARGQSRDREMAMQQVATLQEEVGFGYPTHPYAPYYAPDAPEETGGTGGRRPRHAPAKNTLTGAPGVAWPPSTPPWTRWSGC